MRCCEKSYFDYKRDARLANNPFAITLLATPSRIVFIDSRDSLTMLGLARLEVNCASIVFISLSIYRRLSPVIPKSVMASLSSDINFSISSCLIVNMPI